MELIGYKDILGKDGRRWVELYCIEKKDIPNNAVGYITSNIFCSRDIIQSLGSDCIGKTINADYSMTITGKPHLNSINFE